MPIHRFFRPVVFLVSGVLIAALQTGTLEAQDRRPRPLLLEGKSSVYQRVLTRPGVSRRESPDGAEVGAYPAFQPLYVFARDGAWLEVGGAVALPPEGWVNEEDVIPWLHNIVAAFANPADRERQLLFRDLYSLERLVSHENLVDLSARWRGSAVADTSTEESGVISIEPAEYVDINDPETFYVLPILEFIEDFHPMSAEVFLKMRVVSIPLTEEEPEEEEESKQEALRKADAGIVLVLDATQSMEPYIEETLEAVGEMIGQIKDGPIGDRVNFGVIGFRDNPETVPELVYRVRVFAPLLRDAGIDAPLEGLAQMTASRVSSPGFNEDSLAAIRRALEKTEWAPDGNAYAKKFVILVTDAGPKPPGDRNAESDITAAALRDMAKEMGVGLIAIHLLTPGGIANHDYASQHYRELTSFLDYTYHYPVTGGRDEFGSRIRETITAVMTQIDNNLRGELTEVPERDADGQLPDGAELDVLGLAMELAYLGEVLDTRAPDVFEAWISDRALEDARKIAVEPRLLITKNQLSTLREVLASVLEVGERTQGTGTSGDFFSQLKGAVSRMAADPRLLVNAEFETLGGAFGEFLEGLPYQSRVMEITENRWENMGTGRRQIIDDLRGRFLLYERWHDDPNLWVPLFENAPDGEHVFAMPFEALP